MNSSSQEQPRSGKEDKESGTRSKIAISDSEKDVDGVLEMKETTKDAEGEHNEGIEDSKNKGGSRKIIGFIN